MSSDRFATLIRGGILVLPDTELGLRPVAGDLLMRGDRIMRVGEVGDPPSGARVIYAGGCVAIPGLVQAHTHLNHTLFRGTTDLGEAERWLGDRIWPLESAHTPQSVRAATRLAVAEMLRGGVTAVQAMEAPRHADIVLEVLAESGMVGVCGKTLIDDPAAVPHPLAQPTDVALSEAIDLAESWDGAVDGRIRVALMPFSALACTGACLSELGSLAASGRWRLHLHAVTRPDDIARMQARTDLRDLLWLAEAALVDVQAPHCAPGLDPLWTLVHCSGAADVRAVWLAGKQVVSEGRLTLWDEEEVVGQARREAKGLLQRAGMA